MKEKNAQMLMHWQNKKKKKAFKKVLCNCRADEVKFFCECALNIINEIIPFNVDRLLTYGKLLKILCNAKTCDRNDDEILPPTMGSN